MNAPWLPVRAATELGTPYLAALLLALIGSAAAAQFIPSRWRRSFHGVAGMMFMSIFLSQFMAISLAAFAALVRIVIGQRSSTRRVVVAVLLAVFMGLPLVYGGVFLHFPGDRLPAAELVRALFLVHFLKKLIYYIFERAVERVPPLDADEFFSYFFALPSLVGPIPVAAPSHWRHCWRPGESIAAARHGLQTMVWAALHLVALAAMARWCGWTLIGKTADVSIAHWTVLRSWSVFIGSYVGFYLLRYGYEQFSVGGARLLGWNVRDNYDAPLTAPDYAEHWRRWNTHFRELLVAMFYLPAALALSRRFPGRTAWTSAGAGLATFAGSGCFNFLLRAVFLPPGAWTSYRRLAEQIAVYEAFQWAMVTAANTARLRRLAAGLPPPGPLRRALGMGATLALRGASLPLLVASDPPVGWNLAGWILSAAI